ncbi:hypothetical protein QQZ08_001456 [Neonectria magnoliae]|uniref:Helitron helicase n=1 Tax=Neonectria magnoliae TaxID=2732573 RepID=A0ABR1IG47_9HYPO
MCVDYHYQFCIKVSNARKFPPPTEHNKCEVHRQLAAEIRRGSRQAERDLRRHEKTARQEIVRIHYGDVMDDRTCITDPENPIVNGPGPEQVYVATSFLTPSELDTDPLSSYYKRCDGSYKNAYGQRLQYDGKVPRYK